MPEGGAFTAYIAFFFAVLVGSFGYFGWHLWVEAREIWRRIRLNQWAKRKLKLNARLESYRRTFPNWS